MSALFPTLPFAEVSVTAVLAATALNFFAGHLVYGVLFADVWLAAMRGDKNNHRWPVELKPGVPMLAEIATAIIRAYVLSHLLAWAGVVTVAGALSLALFVWVAFIFGTQMPHNLWCERPAVLAVMDMGADLFRLCLTAVALVVLA